MHWTRLLINLVVSFRTLFSNARERNVADTRKVVQRRTSALGENRQPLLAWFQFQQCHRKKSALAGGLCFLCWLCFVFWLMRKWRRWNCDPAAVSISNLKVITQHHGLSIILVLNSRSWHFSILVCSSNLSVCNFIFDQPPPPPP